MQEIISKGSRTYEDREHDPLIKHRLSKIFSSILSIHFYQLLTICEMLFSVDNIAVNK